MRFVEWFSQLPRVEVVSDRVETRHYVLRDTGESRQSRSQSAYLVYVDDSGVELRSQIRLALGSDQAPYPVGHYTIHGGSFSVGRWGDVEMSRYDFRLLPVSEVVNQLLQADLKKAA